MTPNESKIVARMTRLKHAGRLPELTLNDAAYAAGCSVDDARKALAALVRKRVLASRSKGTCTNEINVWRLL